MDENSSYSKQAIAKEYTRICREVFGAGAGRIKVEFHPGVIVILTQQSQSPTIELLAREGCSALAAQVGDKMGEIFRRQLLAVCQARLGIPVRRLFRDYQDGVTLTYIQLEDA